MPSFRFPLLLSPLLLFAAVPSSAAKPAEAKKSLPEQKRPRQKMTPTRPKPTPQAEQKKPPKKMLPTRHKATASIVDHKPELQPIEDAAALRDSVPKTKKRVKAPPKKTMAQMLADAGSPLTKIVFSTTRLSVRQPWASEDAYLEFRGRVSVLPGHGRAGSARIAGAVLPRNPEIPIDPSAFGPNIGGVDLGPRGKLVIVLTAKPDTGYVVSCNWESHVADPDFGAFVADGGQRLYGGLTRRPGRVTQVIPGRAKRRVVKVKLSAQHGWTTSGCTISSGQ